MLTHLQIRDFALIDAAEIEFRPGLTVLTGPSGSRTVAAMRDSLEPATRWSTSTPRRRCEPG